MDLTNIILLSLIQGVTEFLPISSSAHLIIYSEIFGKIIINKSVGSNFL